LTSPLDLKSYIDKFKRDDNVSESEIENSERFIIEMSDHDISEGDKKHLINLLTKSAELREKYIEYENFENLSYKAVTSPDVIKREKAAGFGEYDFDSPEINDEFSEFSGSDNLSDEYPEFENQEDEFEQTGEETDEDAVEETTEASTVEFPDSLLDLTEEAQTEEETAEDAAVESLENLSELTKEKPEEEPAEQEENSDDLLKSFETLEDEEPSAEDFTTVGNTVEPLNSDDVENIPESLKKYM